MLPWLLACAPADPHVRIQPPAPTTSTPTGTSPPTETGVGLATGDTGPTGTVTEPSACPEGMAEISAFCIDRWEAAIDGHSSYEVPTGGVAVTAEGLVPQAYASGVVAASACAAAGKRLCTLAEWLRACQGPDGTTWPYGDTYDPDACNDHRAENPVIEVFGAGADWSFTEMNDPRLDQLPDSLDPAGANPGCVSAEGVYDLHGNLHEWIDDPDGTFKGGFFVDASINGPGCTYTTTAHSFDYHDYSTGFRCCADVSSAR